MITVSFPANAFTFGSTVTVTVSDDGLGHPELRSVAVNMYDVVFAGVATGLNEFALLRLEAFDHVNAVPFVAAFSCVFVLKQISTSAPAFTVGLGAIDIVTFSVAEHPLIVDVIW
jgi:hypothetical protein